MFLLFLAAGIICGCMWNVQALPEEDPYAQEAAGLADEGTDGEFPYDGGDEGDYAPDADYPPEDEPSAPSDEGYDESGDGEWVYFEVPEGTEPPPGEEWYDVDPADIPETSIE